MSTTPWAGSVVVSIDAELGWGHHDRPEPPRVRMENARDGWKNLLALCDAYRVPATWAIVGHLFLRDCDGRHVDHPTPSGWFARERGEWADRPELRFADGLVEATLDAAVDHEVGCHTFSHVPFATPEPSYSLARAELEASVDAAKRHDLEMDSFVFPRNQVGRREVLAECGFGCYRGVAPRRNDGPPMARPLRKLARATVPGVAPPLVDPTVDEYGLVNVPASQYLFGFEGRARSAVEPVLGDPMVETAHRGIDAAAREGGVFHLWLHPNDLRRRQDRTRVAAVFAHLADRRAETDLRVETMGDVAARVRRAVAAETT